MGLQVRECSHDSVSQRSKNGVKISMKEMHHVICSEGNLHQKVIEIDGAGWDQETLGLVKFLLETLAVTLESSQTSRECDLFALKCRQVYETRALDKLDIPRSGGLRASMLFPFRDTS